MAVTDVQNMRVLLTGGAGFIGSALLWELNRLGNERVVIADFPGKDDKWRHLRTLSFEDYVAADQLLDKLERGRLGRFDLVLHMGACSSTTETDAAYLLKNNYEYTRNLAAWSIESGARFVYASSAATYGSGDQGMQDLDSLAYLQTLRPLNMYGYSKHLFDLFAARTGLLDKIAGLKFFNVFGPNEDHKGDMRSVVAKAFDQISADGSLSLFRSYRPEFADGEQKRDFLYVKEAVRMTLHLAGSGAVGLYNIGSGNARTWNELAAATFAAMDRKPEIRYIDMPVDIRPRYQYFTQADISRLTATGYVPGSETFSETVAEYVREYLVPGKCLGD